MFKKIEIWILYLVILLSFPFAVGFGILVRQELTGSVKGGLISKAALFLAEIPKNIKTQILTEPNLTGDKYPDLNGFNGIPIKEESYLLLSRFDGDIKEGVVELIDLTNFEVLHTWNPNLDKFNQKTAQIDEFKYLKRDKNDSRAALRHPFLLNDGSLVFHNSASPLRKIDACSNLIFENTKDSFHHSIEKDFEGNIWVPSHIYPQTLPSQFVGRDIIEDGGYHDDAIVKLSPNGEILYEKSVSQIFIDNGLEYLLFSVGSRSLFNNDPIHLNDIQPVNFDGDYWKKGDLFLSLRNQSMVFLYRPSTNRIIWKGVGPFFHQHDVDLLDNHRISIFNNNSKVTKNGEVVDGNSEVLIYDFKKNEYSKYLPESLIKKNVGTITQGRSQILPNGDLLVEETNYARTLYFDSNGSLQWTHYNRADNGGVFLIHWSRILYTQEDITNVKNFLKYKPKCE